MTRHPGPRLAPSQSGITNWPVLAPRGVFRTQCRGIPFFQH
uniref:Uncharacterized protein n=1 Tax=Arundo donax TaxID=35708 RepID=A0A0A9L2R3_ARUDO